ncbi:MAG: hypothetical protein ACREDZ_00540 [Kiloniellales bacterium]
MHLESVRSLKEEIRQRILGPLIEAGRSPRTRRSRGSSIALAAGARPKTRECQRLLSIGVAPAGRKSVRLAVRVQRRALLESPAVERIVALARNEVDLRYVGRIQKRASVPWYQKRQRPLRIGCSIGHFEITAGTLGCFVTKDERSMVLSNNHVLANENNGSPGDAILQPGSYDGGKRSSDTVGILAEFVPLRPRATNLVDAAIADLRPRIGIRPGPIQGLGGLAGVAPPLDGAGARVAKLGRTTGLTHGRVTAFELDDVVVAYEAGNLTFDDQIEIEGQGFGPFSDGGDSGSLIVNRRVQGIALLFAGSDQGGRNGAGLTYANPLPTVLDALGVELLF